MKADLDYLQKHTNNSYSSKFSIIDRIIYLLRDKPCVSGDDYCNTLLDAEKGLKKFFGFDSFSIPLPDTLLLWSNKRNSIFSYGNWLTLFTGINYR